MHSYRYGRKCRVTSKHVYCIINSLLADSQMAVRARAPLGSGSGIDGEGGRDALAFIIVILDVTAVRALSNHSL